jgi:hypothetical protein
MQILPYCVFLRDDSLALPRSGVMQSDVETVAEGDLIALVSALEPAQLASEQLQKAALQFHNTISSVFKSRAVVPFRFPAFLSKEEFQSHLGSRAGAYEAFLRAHAGDVQMQVAITAPQAPESTASSGAEYMRRLASASREHEDLAAKLRESASGIALKWAQRDNTRLFALLRRGAEAGFRERLSAVSLPKGVMIRVTGAWPASEFLPQALRAGAKL